LSTTRSLLVFAAFFEFVVTVFRLTVGMSESVWGQRDFGFDKIVEFDLAASDAPIAMTRAVILRRRVWGDFAMDTLAASRNVYRVRFC
jgi:hypothetical protein